MSGLIFVFVHGLSGWGSYDRAYRRLPYWGMRGGDLMAFLREKGFDCRAASVAPAGSAWDRACELYAQLAGTRVDYGAVHSRSCGHARYGRDFAASPLIPSWDDGTRLVLLGHSFGGATVRLFAHLLARGDQAEQSGTPPEELSPLFAGGMGSRVHSLVALASPMNGTTAYDMAEDPSFDPRRVRTPWWCEIPARMMARGAAPRRDGRDAGDWADRDMHIDRALELNARMPEEPGVYYFSVPCCFTVRQADGTHRPRRGMEPLFVRSSWRMGAWSGRTRGGTLIDESWRGNDGLVNTLSASAPLGAPSKPLDRQEIGRGLWNVFPVVEGDHMWPQGGLTHRHDVRAFYLELLTLIDTLPAADA